MALAAESQRKQEQARAIRKAAPRPKVPCKAAPAKGPSVAGRIAAILQVHRFHRHFTAMVITRRYRFFHVSAEDVASEETWYGEAGWYFNAVNPPSSGMGWVGHHDAPSVFPLPPFWQVQRGFGGTGGV
jgi:hypothetical protein